MFTKLTTGIKNISYVIGAVIVLFSLYNQYEELRESKKDRERLMINIENMNKDINHYKTTDGKIAASIDALTIKNNELSLINKKLVDDVETLGIKLKNIQSVSKAEYHYEAKLDTIKEPLKPKSVKLDNNRYNYSFNDDKYIELKTDIVLPVINKDSVVYDGDVIIIKQDLQPKFENFLLKVADSLLIVPEYQYKRSWIFWKKLNGLKLHIKSANPYMNIDKIESYQISK